MPKLKELIPKIDIKKIPSDKQARKEDRLLTKRPMFLTVNRKLRNKPT